MKMEKNIQKVCKKHGLTTFAYSPSNKKYYCKKCSSDNVTNRRRKIKEELVAYKGGKCEICGYDKCIDALTFHHINPEEKSFGISNGNIKNLSALKKEADKCILLCANCHAEIHYKKKMEKERAKNNEEKHNIEEYLEANPNKNGNKIILDIEKIQEELQNNTQKEVAEKNNCSLATLKRFLKANGVHREHKSHKLKTITVYDFLNLFREHDYKKTFLIEYFGVKSVAINEYCFKNNIPWRKEQLKKFTDNYFQEIKDT